MVQFVLQIVDKDGQIRMESTGVNKVDLFYCNAYEEGDKIVLKTSEHNLHVIWQVDDALGSAMCYLTQDIAYQVPFGEKMRVYSPKTFSGRKHYIYARMATTEEVSRYRNLALNIADQHDVLGCYPHASANVETRGESVFAARNAIDGVYANSSHGNWPYESWGINRDPNAQMRLDFGREVRIDHLKILLRADFPHDSYWTQGTVRFSDGSCEVLKFQKTDCLQSYEIAPRTIQWLTFGELIKAEDESPFPALSQIEVYGTEVNI